MEEKATVQDLRTHLAEVEGRLNDLAAQFADRDFTDDAEDEFSALTQEIESTKTKILKREQREAILVKLADKPEHVEAEPLYDFQAPRRTRVPEDVHDLAGYKSRATSLEQLTASYRDGARFVNDKEFKPANQRVSREEIQGDVEGLIEMDNEVALRMIVTSTDKYRREFATYVQGGGIGPELTRAASLTTTAGGFAVPVELDPTLMITNAGVANPVRRISRVRQTNVNTVEFLNTTGITAGYGNEATEASDNTPVLAQPTVNIEKAFAFVPMSIEIAEDWANIQPDVAMAFADAKNQLESSKFLTGLGHASHEPQGLIAVGGATAIVSSATTAVFAVADLYSLENALGPRYRDNASVVGNRATYQKVRQFDTAGGANLWVQLQDPNPPTLIGYPAYEWSSYSSAVTTTGSTILTIGDFNYFAIVDRAGMNVEFIPHLFGGSNRYPTGQRGLYMWWRNSSQVLAPSLSANSAFVSLKLL